MRRACSCVLLVAGFVVLLVFLVWYGSRPDINTLSIVDSSSSVVDKCLPESILCGLKMHQSSAHLGSSLMSLKTRFHELMTSVNSSLCANFTRFGRKFDGGYDVCMTSPFQPVPGSCLVYSFGVSGDWSFDEAMAHHGCQVHSFDPSIGREDHTHQPGAIHFHNIGLWGSDLINNSRNWKLRTLQSIRIELGHQQRVIDVLKVDVELAEWPFLRDVLHSPDSPLSSVKQLLLELHSPRDRSHELSASDLLELIYYASRLSKAFGFHVFRNRRDHSCCGAFAGLMPAGEKELCCHETFYVNTRFRHSKN